jgi:hypothetical protein
MRIKAEDIEMYDENDVIDSEEKRVDKRKLITGKFYNE